MERVRVGVIGVGAFGEFLLRSYAEMPEIELYAVAARHQQRADAAAQRYGIPYAVAGYERLLQMPEVELVVIATPPQQHAEIACAAAEARKHLIVEKPFALTLQQARQVLDAVERHGVCATTNYVMRYMPIYEQLRELIRSRRYGRLRRFVLLNAAPMPHQEWFRDRERSGGILLEHGVHFADVFGWMIGRPLSSIAAYGDGTFEACHFVGIPEEEIVGLFWHSFWLPPGAPEHQSAVLLFEHGHAFVRGWIPLELTLTTAAGVELALQEQDREGLYRRALQQIMREMVAWIRDPAALPRIRLQEAWESLVLAVQGSQQLHPWSQRWSFSSGMAETLF